MEAAEVIQAVIEKLEGPGRYVLELTVRQVYVDATLLTLFAVFLGLTGRWLFKVAKIENDDSEITDPLFTILGWFSIALGSVLISSAISYFVNPEYHAISMLLKKLGVG